MLNICILHNFYHIFSMAFHGFPSCAVPGSLVNCNWIEDTFRLIRKEEKRCCLISLGMDLSMVFCGR